MALPEHIDGIGGSSESVRLNPSFKGGDLGAEDYFVLSRVTGNETLKDVILLSGLPLEECVRVLKRLLNAQAIFIGTPSKENTKKADKEKVSGFQAPRGQDGEVTEEQKERIVSMLALVEKKSGYELFGLTPDAGPRKLKRAYFKYSKEFHPDLYYGKELGMYRDMLDRVFEGITREYNKLVQTGGGRSPKSGQGKKKSASGPSTIPLEQKDSEKTSQLTSQSKEEYAQSLLSRAIGIQKEGDYVGAYKVFIASAKVAFSTGAALGAARSACLAKEWSAAEAAAKQGFDRTRNPEFLAPLAEAVTGLGRQSEASQWIEQARRHPKASPELKATCRSLADNIKVTISG